MRTGSYNDEGELWRYIGRWYNHLFTDDERFGPTVKRLRELVPDASLADIKAVVGEYHGGPWLIGKVFRSTSSFAPRSPKRWLR